MPRELIARSTTDSLAQMAEALGIDPPAESDGEVQPVPEPEPAAEEPKTPEVAADDEEDAEDESVEEPAPSEKKDKRSINARIGKERERTRLAQDRADKLQQELDERKAELEAERSAKKKAEETKPDPDEKAAPEPNEDDFPDTPSWVRAHNKWSREETLRLGRIQAKEKTQQQTEQERREAYETEQRRIRDEHFERVKAFKVEHEDFDEVINRPDIPVNPTMVHAFVNEELGPDLLYYFGKNEDQAKRIAKLDPGRTLTAIGRILAKLEDAKEKAAAEAKEPEPKPEPKAEPVKKVVTPAVSRAPQPTAPVNGSSRSGPVPLDQVEDQAEYKRRRNEELRRRQGL